MNHSLPHNDKLLQLLEQGDERERKKLWDKNSPTGLINEPDWVVLTGNAMKEQRTEENWLELL